MRILFLTHFFVPEIGAAAKRIFGLANNLSDLGHEVGVVSGFPNYPSGIKHESYKGKLYMEELIGKIKVYRYYVFSSPKKNALTRLLNYVSFMLSSSFFAFNDKKYDLIIVSSPPVFIGISGYIISRLKKIPLVFDVRDIWPDIASEMGEMSDSSFTFKVLNNLSRFLYAKARLITVVTKGKKEKLILKGISPDKVEVISNGFDREFLDLPTDVNLVQRYRLEENFTLIYTGVVGLAQGLDIIIDTATKLKEYEKIHFLIIGDGFEKKALEKKAEILGLNSIKFIGAQPYEKILTFLKYAGASIVPLKNKNLKDSVPTKMLEALGGGCPVLLSADGESAEILRESRGGIVVDPGDSEALKEAILYLYNNPDVAKEMSSKGMLYVLNNFTRDRIAQSLSEVLECYVNTAKNTEKFC